MQAIGLLGVPVHTLMWIVETRNKVRPGNTSSTPALCLMHHINTWGTHCVLIIYFR